MTEIINEYTVFHSLETTRLRRAMGHWPLHITIIPPFYLADNNTTILRDIMHHIGDLHAPIQVTFDSVVQRFGSEPDYVEVLAVEQGKRKLAALHGDLLQLLIDEGQIAIKSDRYVGDRYVPHISLREGITKPEQTTIDRICLGRRAINSDTLTKTIISRAPLLG